MFIPISHTKLVKVWGDCVREVSLAQVSCMLVYVYVALPTSECMVDGIQQSLLHTYTYMYM